MEPNLPAGFSESQLQPWQRAQLDRRFEQRRAKVPTSGRTVDLEEAGYIYHERKAGDRKRQDALLALQAAARRRREYEAATAKEGYYFDGVTRLNKVNV